MFQNLTLDFYIIVVDVNVPFLMVIHSVAFADLMRLLTGWLSILCTRKIKKLHDGKNLPIPIEAYKGKSVRIGVKNSKEI